MSLLREYIRGLLVEGEVKFSGILKAMPSSDIVDQAVSIVSSLPVETEIDWDDGRGPVHYDVIPLPSDKFHVTLAHQSVLKPFKKQLKAMDKAGQLPLSPAIQLDPSWFIL